MWQTSMRYGAQINDNMEQSTLLRATLLCQRLQTSVHHRSNDNIDVIYDDSVFALYYTLHFEYFLEIRFIEYKLFTQGFCTSMLCRWVLSTIATSKAPWDKIDAHVKVVNYTSLQWTIDTCHGIIDSQRAPKRPFFFHCTQCYAVWEAACHLWCKVTAKWPIQQCVLTTMNQTNFQLCMPGGLNLDIHILILIDIYYLNLYNNNNILYWTSCTLRHIAGLIKQCQTNVDKCNPLIDIDKCSYPEASSKCLSSLRQLS